MSKTAMIRVRVEPELKEEVEELLEQMGLTATEAINLFYRQISMRKGLPFDVVVPNRTTRKTLKRSQEGKDLLHFDSAEEAFKHLGI